MTYEEETMLRLELVRLAQGVMGESSGTAVVSVAKELEEFVLGVPPKQMVNQTEDNSCMNQMAEACPQPMTEREAALAAMTSAAVWKREYQLQVNALSEQRNVIEAELDSAYKQLRIKSDEFNSAKRIWTDTL